MKFRQWMQVNAPFARARGEKIVGLCQRQRGRCYICGEFMTLQLQQPRTATIDHMLPISGGGSMGARNLYAACMECNKEKGVRPLGDVLLAKVRDG